MTRFPQSLAFFLSAVAAMGCGSVYVVPEDVTGTIVDVTKAPLPGVKVLVGDTLTTTDEAGHFTVHDVAPPYDLAISYSTDAASVGYVYLGMTAPAPTVVSPVLFAPGTPHGSATLTFTLPADTSTTQGSAAVEPTDNMTSFEAGPVTVSPGGAQSYTLKWVGAPSAGIRIHAFQVQVDPATKAPLHYVGYDTTDLVLDDQGHVTWSASYKPPPFSESKLAVTASVPEGYTNLGSALWMRPSGWSLSFSGATGPEMSLLVPDLAGAAFGLGVSADNGAGTSYRRVPDLAAGTQDLAVHVDPAPTLISPPDSGTLGVGSTVTWDTGGPGATYCILSRQSGGGPNFFLWGGDGSATVPDLTPLGLPLPHGEKYVLGLFHLGAAATVEDLASLDYASTQTQEPSTFGYARFREVTTL
jgi:hypothetical protein